MPRICFLVDRFLPLEGGQEIHAYQLSECLTERGSPVTIVTRHVDPRTARREHMGGMDVIRLPPSGLAKGKGWKAVVPMLAFLMRVFVFLLRNAGHYDVVLVSGFKLMTGVAVLACAIVRKPCVVRPESPLDVSEPISAESLRRMGLTHESLPVRAMQAAQRAIARQATRLVAISAEIRERLLQAGIEPARIASIPNGIDLHRFVPAGVARKQKLRRMLKLPADSMIAVYTGRLAYSKGIMMLMDTWREISREFPAAQLVIVGSGNNVFDSCEPELRQYMAEHGLAHCVTLAGNVANVEEYLQAADVFVFPSDYEGFGLSIVEAMAVGLPMVTTRVGVAADIVEDGHNGLLVPPRSRRKLLQAVRRLLGDRSLQLSMGANAHRIAAANYGMPSIANSYLELFSLVLAGGARTSRPASDKLEKVSGRLG